MTFLLKAEGQQRVLPRRHERQHDAMAFDGEWKLHHEAKVGVGIRVIRQMSRLWYLRLACFCFSSGQASTFRFNSSFFWVSFSTWAWVCL